MEKKMEKNNLQELVSRALDYDENACLELAAWYREQGNADMAEHFVKKSVQTKEYLEKATMEAQEEYREWRIEQDKYYAEAMQKVWKGTPICMLCTQINRMSMLYWLVWSSLLGEYTDIDNFPYMTHEGSEKLFEAAQSFMKVHKRVHIAIYSKEVIREQYEKFGIKDFYFDMLVPASIVDEVTELQRDLHIDIHFMKNQNIPNNIPSGFQDLDNITSGWQNGNLIIVAALPKGVKTSFILSMVKNIAVDNNIPVGMFSLEMSNLQLVNRLLQNVCNIPDEKVKTGKFTKADWSQLTAHIDYLREASIYVDDTPGLSVADICAKARDLVNEHGAKVIMIDYLQLMNIEELADCSKEERISSVLHSLKDLAKNLNIPIILGSMLDSDVNQYADVVCTINCPNGLLDLAEIIVEKHPQGTMDKVNLKFFREFSMFENVTEECV